MFTFDTPRLHIREFTADDFEFVYRMQSDPEIMQFIRAAEPDRAVVRARMEAYLKYQAENPGYGFCMIETLEKPEIVGYGVVRHAEFTPGKDVEVGYIIAREHWGKGYATESTRGMMTYARQTLGVHTLVAYTSEENNASNHVLEKCGFTRTGIEKIYDADCLGWRYNF